MEHKRTGADWRTEAPQGYRIVRRVEEEPLWTLAVAKDGAGQLVLLKVFTPLAHRQEELRTELLASLRASNELGHPQILRLSGLAEEESRLAGIYDFPGGESLRARLRNRKAMGVAEACRLGLQVALALQYLHQQGLVQGVLTPASVWVDEEGNAMLHEVALARLARLLLERGAPNIRSRYVPYLAPEQLAEGGQATFLSDVYAIGILLYELLAGEPPFAGATAQEVVDQHLHSPASAVGMVNPQVPESLSQVVARCLEKEPARRFSSCAALMDALEAELLRLPSAKGRRPRRKGKGPRLVPSIRLKARAWALLLPGLLIAGVLAAGALLMLKKQQGPGNPPVLNAELDRQVAATAAEEGTASVPSAPERAPVGTSHARATAESTPVAPRAKVLPASLALQVHVGGAPVQAEIFVDGARLGRAETRAAAAVQVEPQLKHAVRVSRPGYLPWDSTLTLAPGEHKALSVELRPEPGATVEVAFEQVDFAGYVRIDDTGEARALPATLLLSVGRHVLEYLDREGNPMWRGARVFDFATPRPYRPDVSVEFGELAIVVENAAEVGYGYVLIDGQEWKSGGTSATPLRALVPSGQHRVRLVRDGFRVVPTDTTVVVQPGQLLRLSFRLYPLR